MNQSQYSQSEHTSGPWETFGSMVWSPSSKRVVAAACEPEPKSHCVEYERADIGSNNLNEVYANARLIAAAPDLLNALIETLAELDMARHATGSSIPSQIEKDALAVLAKARG